MILYRIYYNSINVNQTSFKIINGLLIGKKVPNSKRDRRAQKSLKLMP